MNDLVSEFFIDIITRIIPGFIILALYLNELFTAVFSKFHDIPFLLIPCLIGVAWVIGFAVERATYVPFAFICNRQKEGRLKDLVGDHSRIDCFKSDDPELLKDFNLFRFNRRHELKLTGERIFCRVMFAVCVVTCSPFPPSKLPLWHEVPVYSILGVVVFGLSWYWMLPPKVEAKKETKDEK